MIHSFIVLVNGEPFLIEIKGMSYMSALKKVEALYPDSEIFSNIKNI